MVRTFLRLLGKTQGTTGNRISSFLSNLSEIFPIKTQRNEPCIKADCICIGNLDNSFIRRMTALTESGHYKDVVRVFHGKDEEKVRIVMQIYGATRTVNRSQTEPLCMSLERIKTNIKNANAKLEKKYVKKMKKENQQNTVATSQLYEPTAALFDQSGTQIDDQVPIIEAWEKGKLLKICDLSFKVVCNPPQVEHVKLIKSPLVGCPIHPQLQLNMVTLENSRFEWYRCIIPREDTEMDTDVSDDGPPGKHKMDSSDAESVDCDTEDNENNKWELIGTETTYTATENDVGYSLKVKLLPGNEKYPYNSEDFQSESVSATTEGVVSKGPEKCLFDERSKHTIHRCSNGSFRFVCYNILADTYASSEYAHDFLFPYCPTYAIDIGYRVQLVLKELSAYNADVICLQEVDRFVFESQLMPAMSLRGFAGAFAAKDGIKEGVAMFYRRDKFRLLMVDNIILRKAIKEERNKDLYNKIAENNEFLGNFLSKPTCLLVGVLQSVEDEKKHILLGNNHLFWHPNGCHLRMIQAEVVLREMRRLYAEHSNCENILTIILTGDFNCNPFSGAVQLLTQGEVQENHADWYSMGKAEFLRGMRLTNTTKLESACGYPAYSNFVTRFRNTLDYIFIDPQHLKVEKVIPPPSHEDVIRFSALPNESAPSDHIAQVADLSWKT